MEMKKLHNLPIKKKFAIVIVPLITIILCFDYLEIRHDYLDYYDSKRLNKAINIGIEINHLVHELQKERGISSGYLSTNGQKFGEQLINQRSRTDSVSINFFEELERPEYKDLMTLHEEDIIGLRAQLDRVNELRMKVDDLRLKVDQVINYYSEINKAALNTVSSLINETRDKEAAQQVHAIIYFLESKEYASVERALGTQIFSIENPDKKIVDEFTSLIAAQGSYLDAFLTICNKESYDFYHRTMAGQDIEEVDRMRSLLYNGEQLEEDPGYWYQVITSKINLLKRVEEYLLDHMHAYTEGVAAQAQWDFWTFLMIDLLGTIISILLMAYIVSKLIKNVEILDAFTRKVAKSDYSQQVEIDSGDEIGQYAETFNSMVREINKSHRELQKEKDHAEYLYENIYKQSEVVFENVEQGIFLLDKELKISNLYSKAVERIFDNKIIANENFCNFMRPRIIQRDFEALEMFMKHLFNADMDEEVVNQLNPIEQVKIFIGTNGVVITKYLRVSFTRIEHDGDIQNIMVTISDETESVLLQQHMEESEAKKKLETEYMLNVLKVDPTILRDFLTNTKRILKGISTKYENSSKSNLNDLLKYTFETIHNIKGNAMSIGLQLITDKLHEIEESITGMRDRNVTPDKFLTILFEIEEIDKVLTDMSKMLTKIADIYRDFPSHGQTGSVPLSTVDESLRQGLAMMSKETNKQVELEFKHPKNIEIPEQRLIPIKDIVIQLMRNSLSHGIETPDERLASGKEEVGRITLRITQPADGQVEITYKDDGRGLDLEDIKQKALRYGLISDKDAVGLNNSAIAELLFENGFSTKEDVDNLSGRGQGLSLVKSILQEIGGSYAVKFRKNKFFELKFTVPTAMNDKMKKAA